MNYRHAFHAGNFADVVKHALLARILVYLTRKDAPFLYLDTHAGVGRYDLSADEARRTGEWRDGVGRMAEPLPGEAEGLLAPWRAAVAAEQARFGPNAYPGSPAIAQALTRRGDRLLLCEKHPADARALVQAMGRDARVKAIEIDGWTGLNAYVPPKERRGLVLIDPPFEEAGEIDRMADALVAAWRKWPGGVYAAWAPIKDLAQTRRLGTRVVAAGVTRVLWLEAIVGAPERVDLSPRVEASPRAETSTRVEVSPRVETSTLIGTAMMVVNPPFTLAQEARILLPALATRLGRSGAARGDVFHLAGETRAAD